MSIAHSILVIILFTISFVVAIGLSFKLKVHALIACLVLLIFGKVIFSELCWLVLSCNKTLSSDPTKVMTFINAIELAEQIDVFILDLLLVSTLVIVKRKELCRKTRDNSQS